MTDRNQERGEQRKDHPLRQAQDDRGEGEPQEDARPNNAPSQEEGGRDAGRPGSESNPS